MDKFVVSANLPENAELVLIGEKYLPQLQNALEIHGVRALAVPANPMVDHRLASHADLSVFHAGENAVFLAEHLKETKFAAFLAEIGINLHYITEKLANYYPFDALLNICSIGKHFVYNPKVNDSSAAEYLKGQGREAIFCKQGYCKCSVCVVDDNSIITADKGISAVCKARGIDVLEIQPAYVKLDGFEYGFLGGAAFKICSDKMAFTGILDLHPDRDNILSFLEAHGVEPVFLTSLPIFDIGSAIPICEKQPKN